jgi:hypothetical protein
MEILDRKKLNEKMWKAYDNQPLGWKYFFGKDNNGNYNIIITNKILGEQYWMKFTSPYGKDQIFVGVRAAIEDEEISKLKSSFFDTDFGIRPVNLTEKEVIGFLKGERGAVIKELEKAINKTPVPREEVENSIVTLTGVYQHLVVKSLDDISPSQRKLNKKLETELKRLKELSFNYVC